MKLGQVAVGKALEACETSLEAEGALNSTDLQHHLDIPRRGSVFIVG